MNVATATQALQHYLEGFTSLEKSASSHQHPWLRKLRQDAFARFAETGFPTTRDEDWRFTNLSAIAQTPFRLVCEVRSLPSQSDIAPYHVAGAACQLVFVDGRFAPELSSFGRLPDRVTITNLAAEIERRPAVVEQHLGRYLNIQRDAFSALNTAFIEDGAFVHIPKSIVLEGPIHLLFISLAHGAPTVSHPRNLIVAEENSQATIVEDYISLGSSTEKALCNTVTELVAGDHSVISHYMIEREHRHAFNVSTLRIQQGRAADVSSHSVLIGGALVRNNVHPVLACSTSM